MLLLFFYWSICSSQESERYCMCVRGICYSFLFQQYFYWILELFQTAWYFFVFHLSISLRKRTRMKEQNHVLIKKSSTNVWYPCKCSLFFSRTQFYFGHKCWFQFCHVLTIETDCIIRCALNWIRTMLRKPHWGLIHRLLTKTMQDIY